MTYCTKCGDLQVEGSRFCKNCGAPLEAGAPPAAPPAPPSRPGRGAAILALGILSVVMLGLVTGIPAWIMGKRDLKKIRSGEIAAAEENFTKAGMIMGIVGTCLSVVTIILAIVFFYAVLNHARWGRPYRIESVRDQMLADLRAIATDAASYRAQQATLDGEATYVGYEIPDSLRLTETAEYSEGSATSVVISFYGESNDGMASVTVTVDADGKLVSVHFYDGAGDDESWSDARGVLPRAPPRPAWL